MLGQNVLLCLVSPSVADPNPKESETFLPDPNPKKKFGSGFGSRHYYLILEHDNYFSRV
jgi:hypothetical protein